ncbi:MAG: alkaline phosphatase family protein, partial [Candidatus Omnitrophica bacterium]|nr:alkaline phosphatase family protein [Candidatus Omnitrophota bacterium]
SKKTGPYYTQGMPHDTWVLTEGWVDEKVFLEHVDMILEERKKVLMEGMRQFKNGVFFFYIDTLDIVQHMFWRYIDPQHPLFQSDSLYKDTIYNYYEKIDRILGAALKELDEDSTLIILSDHGFGPFRRTCHLNRWLLENGFLALQEGKNQSADFFKDVDWPNTKAYALGFGGIYINKRGREGQGIVSEQEEDSIKKDLSERLMLWTDPVTQEKIVKDVYKKERIFDGAYTGKAPDLFVGFNSGFRASWQTALGGVPEALIEDNQKKWSGDHLVDPSLVPGVIFTSEKIDLSDPSIIDLAPMILGLFDIPDYKKMDGKDHVK